MNCRNVHGQSLLVESLVHHCKLQFSKCRQSVSQVIAAVQITQNRFTTL
ncbi:hypothetical protein WAE56_13120 [Iodobacter sp. LRB]|nr:hypothetical protein [Iodobacter sp. BJB302]